MHPCPQNDCGDRESGLSVLFAQSEEMSWEEAWPGSFASETLGLCTSTSLQPVSRRFGKEFFQGDALAADEQLPLGFEQPDEGIHARK